MGAYCQSFGPAWVDRLKDLQARLASLVEGLDIEDEVQRRAIDAIALAGDALQLIIAVRNELGQEIANAIFTVNGIRSSIDGQQLDL